MSEFRYWRDPLFLTSCALYVLNRAVLKQVAGTAFLRNHFNDLLLIPCALPLILWLHRILGLRAHDGYPTTAEIAGHCIFWSILCEWIGPLFLRTTGDPRDILAYAAGAVFAGLWWRIQHARELATR